ncbi:MAG TPA: ATP-binding protein [Opitutaceae bacterium]|nr:ATP-binding protein [Opitutaceae bacterium]
MSKAVRALLTPPVFADAEATRVGRIVHILCLGLAVGMLLPIAHNAVMGNYVSVAVLVCQGVCFLACWRINRRGATKWAAHLFVLTLLVVSTVLLCAANEGIHDMAIMVYPAALLAGGLLLSQRAFVGTAILAVLCLAGVVWAELHGILVTPLSAYTSWSNLIDGAVILGLTTLAVGLLVGDLRASLSREREHTEAWRQSEARYRHLFEYTPVSVWVEDTTAVRRELERLRASGVSDLDAYLRAHPPVVDELYALIAVVEVNTTALQIFQAGSKQELLANLSKTLTEQSRAAFRAALVAMWEQRNDFSSEFTAATLRGQRIECALRWVTPVVEGRPDWARVIITITDITERKRAEMAVRQAEEKYRGIFEGAMEGIFQSTPQGRFLTVNPALTRMLGYASAAELIAAIPDISRQLFVDPVRQAEYAGQLGERGVVRDFECEWYCKDARRIWVSIGARVALDPNGEAVYYDGTVADITEHKRLTEQYRQAQKMEAFGQLAGGMAHDFNNIMTVVQSHASLLQLKGVSPAEQEESVKEISHASERAANLTRQLLTFSRQQVSQPTYLDLNEVVGSTAKLLQRLIGANIALDAQFAPGGAPVVADLGMMEQVLMNLAVNARDAMPKGGRLSLATAIVTFDAMPASASPKARPGRFVRLSISDTGCGIAPEHLPRIFEPFFTTKEVGKGTGLGLATVLGIVEQHQGWIDVESQSGRGTTFRIYLPFQNDEFAFSPVKPVMTEVRGGTETILLVEDEAVVRALAKKVLGRKGYTVLEADRSQTALELWRLHQAKIDLLLTDIIMPGTLSGRDLAERLLREKPGLKVVYCSGYSDDVLGHDFIATGRFNFLQKPYDPLKLARIVRDHLDG